MLILSRMRQYLEAMPDGLSSLPEVQQKATVVASFVQGTRIERHLDVLPPELARHVRGPLTPTAWLPEVQVHALYLAISELCFESERAWLDFAYQANLRLLSGPLYAILFRMLGPRRIATGVASRWGQLHRGTSLSLVSFEGSTATVGLEVPPHHLPTLMAQGYATAIRAAFEVAGCQRVKVDCVERSSQRVEFVATWAP